MEQWEAGQFQADGDPLKIAVANAGALSQVRLLRHLMELTYEQFAESFDDASGEYIRLGTPGSRGSGSAHKD